VANKFKHGLFVVNQNLKQGSGTYGSPARCGSFDDGIWLA